MTGKATVGDPRLDLPRRCSRLGARQGAILAGDRTGAAERAFSALEIHLGITAHRDDDARRADVHACAATSAGIDEGFFRQRPGRTLRRAAGLEIPPHELSATYHGYKEWSKRERDVASASGLSQNLTIPRLDLE